MRGGASATGARKLIEEGAPWALLGGEGTNPWQHQRWELRQQGWKRARYWLLGRVLGSECALTTKQEQEKEPGKAHSKSAEGFWDNLC